MCVSDGDHRSHFVSMLPFEKERERERERERKRVRKREREP